MQADIPSGKITHSIPSAIKQTDLSRATLYKLIKAGRLKTIKVGARTLIADDDLRSCMASFR